MGYQALLFCPDEKLARVVSQVFTELDFTVDPVHEPFAAVKKLMAQRFDAIVVDCENEQNASLLFKSARNSGSNQSSLAIALVEGQAGVAKAYRIGANLVLTKPINVEQAKGTLRVARGLLRKNSDAASASVASTATAAKPQKTFSESSSPSSPAHAPAPTQAPGRAPLSFAASAPAVTPVGYSQHTASQNTDSPHTNSQHTDTQHTDTRHLDSQHPEFADQPLAIVPDLAPSQFPTMSASSAQDESASIAEIKSQIELENSFPKQPTSDNNGAASVEKSPAFYPTAPVGSVDVAHSFSGLKQAADQVSSTPFTTAGASNSLSPNSSQNRPQNGSSTGSAAAAAPAKEVAAVPVHNPVNEMATSPATASLQPVSKASGFVFDAAPMSDAPTFGTLSGEEDSGGSGGNKKMLIAAAAVLAVAALGYLGYTKMSGDRATPTTQPVSASQSLGQPTSAPATSSSPSTSLSTTGPASPNSTVLSAVPTGVPATSTPKIAVSASPGKIAVASGNPPTIHIGVDTAANGTLSVGSMAPTKKPASSPIQMKSSDGTAGQSASSSSSDDSAPSLAASSAGGPGNNGLSSLMSSSSSAVPIPTLATVRVSQGVSQGLVIKRVQPKYPPAALAAHTTGAVQIEATVSKDGTVTNAKVLSGDQVLARAALEAVRQWRYKPYYLDGAPVEIQTQITVNFKAN